MKLVEFIAVVAVAVAVVAAAPPQNPTVDSTSTTVEDVANVETVQEILDNAKPEDNDIRVSTTEAPLVLEDIVVVPLELSDGTETVVLAGDEIAKDVTKDSETSKVMNDKPTKVENVEVQSNKTNETVIVEAVDEDFKSDADTTPLVEYLDPDYMNEKIVPEAAYRPDQFPLEYPMEQENTDYREEQFTENHEPVHTDYNLEPFHNDYNVEPVQGDYYGEPIETDYDNGYIIENRENYPMNEGPEPLFYDSEALSYDTINPEREMMEPEVHLMTDDNTPVDSYQFDDSADYTEDETTPIHIKPSATSNRLMPELMEEPMVDAILTPKDMVPDVKLIDEQPIQDVGDEVTTSDPESYTKDVAIVIGAIENPHPQPIMGGNSLTDTGEEEVDNSNPLDADRYFNVMSTIFGIPRITRMSQSSEIPTEMPSNELENMPNKDQVTTEESDITTTDSQTEGNANDLNIDICIRDEMINVNGMVFPLMEPSGVMNYIGSLLDEAQSMAYERRMRETYNNNMRHSYYNSFEPYQGYYPSDQTYMMRNPFYTGRRMSPKMYPLLTVMKAAIEQENRMRSMDAAYPYQPYY